MSRQSLRAFSFGIIFTTIIFAIIYYFQPGIKQNQTEELKAYLQQNNLKTISTKEYQELTEAKEKLAKLEKENTNTSHAKEASQEVKQVFIYSLFVKKGMTSTEVATQLQKAHIINNAQQFNHYLKEHHLQNKIQTGTYDLNNQMSISEIATIITTKK